MPAMEFSAAVRSVVCLSRPPAGIHRATCLLAILLAFAGNQAPAQDALSPTEAYKAALLPFAATRSQANDLTDADKIALGIGMNQAARDCLALTAHPSAFTSDEKQLFALGQLCLFGQQFEPARVTLVQYLALPKPPQREQALVFLAQAFLGLKQPDNAKAQVDSLLRDYTYDASIHVTIDQVLDDMECSNTYLNKMVLDLCATQSAATMPLLATGNALEGKDTSASAAKLFADAVRCGALAGASGKPGGQQQLAGFLQQSNWSGTADRVLMQSALQRQQMVGAQVPMSSTRGQQVAAKALVARTLSLKHGTVILIPFTLWSPSMAAVAQDLVRLAPQQPIYAITSWRANTGAEDAPSSQVLNGLRSLQRSLPTHVTLLVVPDAMLSAFHADSFPAGILIRNGTVLSNSVISSHGAERCLFSSTQSRSRADSTASAKAAPSRSPARLQPANRTAPGQ
jgi:hypothetical protein